MGDGQPAYPYVAVGRQQSQLLADMDTIIRGEFKTKFNGILIREIIRTTAKTVVQKQLNDSSPWLGLIAAVAQAATTQADLRGWLTLPQNFQLLNVPYPANKQVVLSFPGIEDITVAQIGRASCRERVGSYGYISGVAASLKKKKKH